MSFSRELVVVVSGMNECIKDVCRSVGLARRDKARM